MLGNSDKKCSHLKTSLQTKPNYWYNPWVLHSQQTQVKCFLLRGFLQEATQWSCIVDGFEGSGYQWQNICRLFAKTYQFKDR